MRVGHGCTCCVRPPGVQEVEHQDSHWMPQNSTDLWRHPQGNNRRRQRTPIQPRWQQREWVPLHGQLGNQPSPQSQQSPTTSCWKTLGEGLPNRHFPGLRWMGRHPRLHGKWIRVWQGSNGQSRPRRQPHGTHDRTPNQATYQDAVDWVPEEEKSEMAVLVLRPQRDVHGARRLPRGRAGCRYSNAAAHPWGWIGDLLGLPVQSEIQVRIYQGLEVWSLSWKRSSIRWHQNSQGCSSIASTSLRSGTSTWFEKGYGLGGDEEVGCRFSSTPWHLGTEGSNTCWDRSWHTSARHGSP